jgi:hypothetical protein
MMALSAAQRKKVSEFLGFDARKSSDASLTG